MTHQQRQHHAHVLLVMKSRPKILILMTNAQPVNHVVHVMIAEIVVTAGIAHLVANNLLTNPQNQLCMSVPMASH
jgi:hypothetical protein